MYFWIFTLYFGLSSIVIFPFLKLLQLWSLGALSVGFIVPLTDPILWGFVFVLVLLYILWFPAPVILPICPGIPGSCYWRMVLEPRSGHWVCPLLWAAVLGLLSGQSKDICVWVLTCVHTHGHLCRYPQWQYHLCHPQMSHVLCSPIQPSALPRITEQTLQILSYAVHQNKFLADIGVCFFSKFLFSLCQGCSG